MKKTVRKLIAIGCAGAVIGGTASLFMAAPASALLYARCDSQLTSLETSAATQLKKHKITQAQYDAIMAEVAAHRLEWGC